MKHNTVLALITLHLFQWTSVLHHMWYYTEVPQIWICLHTAKAIIFTIGDTARGANDELRFTGGTLYRYINMCTYTYISILRMVALLWTHVVQSFEQVLVRLFPLVLSRPKTCESV